MVALKFTLCSTILEGSRTPLKPLKDSEVSSLPVDHRHVNYSDASPTPSNWREHLSCRKCKRNLVLYLGESMLCHSSSLLRGQQRLILAGCFPGEREDQACETSSSGTQPMSSLDCGAEVADTRVWLHVLRTGYTRVLVCSPDTDVYHIGFPLLSPKNDVVVHLHKLGTSLSLFKKIPVSS